MAIIVIRCKVVYNACMQKVHLKSDSDSDCFCFCANCIFLFLEIGSCSRESISPGREGSPEFDYPSRRSR